MTRGPLDADDGPLSPSSSLASSAIKSPISPARSPARFAAQVELPSDDKALTPDEDSHDSVDDRDLSFLLEANIYHPLSQVEVPAPFRRPFSQPLTAASGLSEALSHLTEFLSHCDYLRAAHLAGLMLVSGLVKPTDQRTIFRLLSIRYSCLELSGNVLLAAQEAKSLEDLGSTFYYIEPPHLEDVPEEIIDRPPPKHIVPFHLRIQALRLQSIGFSDPRRGVSSLYDLGAECREHLQSPGLSNDERTLWTARLQEVGFRVINALIEMGDLDCARRAMNTTKPEGNNETSLWNVRKVILCLRMGLLKEAQRVVAGSVSSESEKAILESLIAIADERFDEAASLLRQPEVEEHALLAGLAKQNLAVVYLYQGNIQQAKDILETLVEDGHSFQTLTINLATVYDLTTDKARERKLMLADGIARRQKQVQQAQPFTNADFKL
jgi:trafficking protein particle complex subunit 12